MDEKHTWILRLYEPTESAGEVETLTSAEQAELEAVRPVKAALEALPRQRPGPQVLAAVVADAMHAPIRHLYGVGEPPILTEAQQAEAIALSEVKEAVESLPARRPDSDVVAAVGRDATHPAVRELYSVAAPTSLSARDEAEVKALAPLRDALATMPRQRPHQTTLDAVFAAAAAPARPFAADRAAQRPARRRRALGWVTGLAGAVLIFASAWWITQEEASPEPLVAEVRTAAPDPLGAQSLESGSPEQEASGAEAAIDGATETASSARVGAVAQASPPPQRQAQPQTQAPSPTAGQEQQRVAAAPIQRVVPIRPDAGGNALARAVVAPQDVDDSALRLLYMRLESLHDENLPWDAPAVVLGVDRTPTPTTTHGWMQVRVDR